MSGSDGAGYARALRPFPGAVPAPGWDLLPAGTLGAGLDALRSAILDTLGQPALALHSTQPLRDDERGGGSRFHDRHLSAVRPARRDPGTAGGASGDTGRGDTGRGDTGRGDTGAPGNDTDGHSASGRPAGANQPVDDEHREVWALVERARGGDAEAFGVIYDRYADVVYRYVFYRVGDRGLAEDLTSETFLRALRRISSVSYQGRDIGAWFVTIARNLILDHVKSARSRLESTTDEIGLVGDHAASTVRPPTPEALVLDALTSQALMAAVDQLGLEQRECVMLRFVQGFSVSETAEIMGKNDGAIKALQHRAVRKLAGLLGDSL